MYSPDFLLAMVGVSSDGVVLPHMVVNALKVRPLLPFQLGLHRYHPVATRWVPGPCPVTNGGSRDGDLSELLREWEAGKLCSSGTPYSLDSRKYPCPFAFLFAPPTAAAPFSQLLTAKGRLLTTG